MEQSKSGARNIVGREYKTHKFFLLVFGKGLILILCAPCAVNRSNAPGL